MCLRLSWPSLSAMYVIVYLYCVSVCLAAGGVTMSVCMPVCLAAGGVTMSVCMPVCLTAGGVTMSVTMSVCLAAGGVTMSVTMSVCLAAGGVTMSVCMSVCLAAGGVSGCSSCSAGYQLLHIERTCVTCLDHEYFSARDGTCQTCHQSCATCRGAGHENCTSCAGESVTTSGPVCLVMQWLTE